MKQHFKMAKAEVTDLLRPSFRNYPVTFAISVGRKVTESTQIQGRGSGPPFSGNAKNL